MLIVQNAGSCIQNAGVKSYANRFNRSTSKMKKERQLQSSMQQI
jgi:hypothetical protein